MGGDLAVISNIWEQGRIKAAFEQIRGNANRDNYWIGLEKKGRMDWVPYEWKRKNWLKEQIHLDSKLQFAEQSNWKDKDEGVSRCGTIGRGGIDFSPCEQGLVGYVCGLPFKAATCGN